MILRSSGEFSSTSVSRSSTVTRPTAAFQTRTRDGAIGQRAGHAHFFAVPRIQRERQRRVARIDRRILGHLLPIAVDALVEIALAIKQPHGDERQAQVARGLAVVAGEDAQAARVDRKALMQAELGAEVGDQVVLRELGAVGVTGFPRGSGRTRRRRCGSRRGTSGRSRRDRACFDRRERRNSCGSPSALRQSTGSSLRNNCPEAGIQLNQKLRARSSSRCSEGGMVGETCSANTLFDMANPFGRNETARRASPCTAA